MMALIATMLSHSLRWGAAVLGGGLLIGISFLAYVMIARLRLPPLGLIAGASSFAVAAAFETLGILRKKH